MARNALQDLDDPGLLGGDSVLFISEHADGHAPDGEERSNGLGRATGAAAAAAEAAFGLDVAMEAPEATPIAPEIPDLPATGPFPGFEIGGVVVTDPHIFGVKPDGAGGGGKGKPPKDDDPDSGSSVLSSYTSGGDAATSFNIEVIFKGGGWTEALQQAFIDAADYLSTIITADISDVFFRGKIIDDIRIDAKLTSIDGVGGILGQAGPTAYRTSNFLPATAIMEFDTADADQLLTDGLWPDVIFHEMMHSIGFGTMWELMGLVTDVNGDLRFNGDLATAQYALEFDTSGDPLADIGVPIETDFGPGTAGGHWDEETFDTEIMTGIIGSYADLDPSAENYLSDMTVAALDDMGYDVDYSAGSLFV